MKACIYGILQHSPIKLNSHNAGWTYVYKNMIEQSGKYQCVDVSNRSTDINDYDSIYINEGVNFKSGQWNLFGGMSHDVIQRLKDLNNYKGSVYCWGHNAPDYNHLSIKRIDGLIKFNKHIEPLDSILNSNNLILGDSHSISIYKPAWEISRNDGNTLYSFLHHPENYIKKSYDKVHAYFGNIDIRFHLCRQADPKQATLDLVNDYIKLCYKENIIPTCLLPIESESRKIPKSGLYKGKPFFGSRELRSELMCIFNDNIIKHFDQCIQWPTEWYDNIDWYEKNVMESKQSVHVRPEYYNSLNLVQKKQQSALF